MPQFYPNNESSADCPWIADSTSHWTLGGLNTVTIAPIVATGDLLVFITGGDGTSEATGTSWTAPSGATEINGFPYLGGSGWAPFINAWQKIATSGDSGAQYTFGKTNSGAQTSFALIIKDHTSVTAGTFGFNGTALSGNPGTISQASTVFSGCGISLIMGFAQNHEQLLPVPNQPPYTQIEQTYPAYRGGSLGSRIFNASGTTGIRDWDIGTIGNNAFSVGEVVVH